MGQAIAEQQFVSQKDVKKWLNEWFAAKSKVSLWHGIHTLPGRLERPVYHFSEINMFLKSPHLILVNMVLLSNLDQLDKFFLFS